MKKILGKCQTRVPFVFWQIRKRIIDPRSFGSRCVKGTFPRVDSSVSSMHRDANDLGPMTVFGFSPQKAHPYLSRA